MRNIVMTMVINIIFPNYTNNSLSGFYRSTRSKIFHNLGVLKNFARYTVHKLESLFERPAALLKRDSNAGAFL